MQKTIMLAVIFSILVFGIFVVYFFKKTGDGDFTTVKIGAAVVNVELADTNARRAKGLMYRRELGENDGMLFIFPNEGNHAFWMANTYIPLDMLWIDSNNKVVHIEENVPSCEETGTVKALCKTYQSNIAAKYVLEVNAGWVARNGVVVGDSVVMSL